MNSHIFFSYAKKIISFARRKSGILLSRLKRSSLPASEILEKRAVFHLSRKRVPRFKQLRYSWRIFSKAEQKILKIVCAGWLVTFAVFAGVFIYNRTAPLPAFGGTYIEGMARAPQYLNPVLAFNNETDTDLNRLIFSGLLRYNERLELVPDIATQYDISEDQKVYTFTIRDDIFWHDGTPLSVDDIIFTIEAIQNPQFASPHFGKFQGVKVKKINDVTVQFFLEKPFAPFLNNLTIGIIPRHIWQNIPPANAKLAESNLKPIGTGPYRFKKLQKDPEGNILSYTLEAYRNYHNGVPFIKTMQFKLYPDLESAVAALKKQNIDGLNFLPKQAKQDLQKNKNLKFYTFTLPQYTAIFFNETRNEQLKEKKIREALALALDKKAIIQEVLDSEAQIINGPILPGFIGYHPELITFPYDPAQAENILEQEGWVMQEGENIRKKDDKTLEITLTTVDVADNINTTERIRALWEAIGVKVNLEIVPKQSIEKEIIVPRNYQALLFGEIFGADPDPFPFWHSSRRKSPGLNLTNFSHKEADALLEQGRSTNNPEKRNKLYQKFQEILIDQLPAIFLYSPTYTYPVQTKVRGINQTKINTPADRFNGVSTWYIKTKRKWKN